MTPSPRFHFEHFGTMPQADDYAAPDALALEAKYCAAWKSSDLAPNSLARPKMIRVTLAIDDPRARITEGQMHEYVMDLP